MATNILYSHSPRVSERSSPRMQAANPITPVHSPHHSVTSSVSSRTPIHTLTIHEYRKQQNTPTSLQGTPSGRTLRRKAAASALNDIERVPSVSRATRSGSSSSLRPLHFSRSAQQLKPSQLSFQQQPLLDPSLRSQSAEPRVQAGSISSISTVNSSGKVRHFNSRKRLPRPSATTAIPPVHVPFANAKQTQLRSSPVPASLNYSTEHSHSSDAQTTPTQSTFSLSRFPQPPHSADPSFSPPHDEREITCVNAPGFSTTAPVTPPATPAIIHYRGASFDLVNPHDSLILHDIVTPSRDFESSEFLPLQSSENSVGVSSEVFIPFSLNFASANSQKMAPKRALYGDFTSAHAGILRNAEDAFGGSNLDLPLPPTPAAISPSSSAYTSPLYSPESINAPLPLSIRKQTNESRFSLKQLTRTLTHKLARGHERSHGEELLDMRNPGSSAVSTKTDSEYPQPLTKTYYATPQPPYVPVRPVSPITPTSVWHPEKSDSGFPRRDSATRYDLEPLASMVPDDPSTQVGRMSESQLPISGEGVFSKPYYDDLDSIYPSSSIYTADDRRKSNYQQSIISTVHTNPFLRFSNMDATDFATEYNPHSSYGFENSHRASREMSRLLTQELYHRSVDQGDLKTDTISKFIDRYHPSYLENDPLPVYGKQSAHMSGAIPSSSGTFELVASDTSDERDRATSGLSQFEFDLLDTGKQEEGFEMASPILTRRPTITRDIGSPPREAPPLAPPFPFDEALGLPMRPVYSETFTNESSYSYGDTQTLLQVPTPGSPLQLGQDGPLEASSSYSQPENNVMELSSSYTKGAESNSPRTPQEALDQADEIFQSAGKERKKRDRGIPAMWTRRNSGSLLLNRKLNNHPSKDVVDASPSILDDNDIPTQDKADWETIGGNSRKGHESFDSIADYSSSEGSRNSLGLNPDGSLPSWAKQDRSEELSYYNHPSPLRSHPNTFNSSPPAFQTHIGNPTEPEEPSLPTIPVTTSLKTAPIFRDGTDEPRTLARWNDPYAFSDKETQELLASGPNDKIIFDDELDFPGHQNQFQRREHDSMVNPTTPDNRNPQSVHLERENTFEKLSTVGPKGNLTGTPYGTGMHETGSSIADTSSPGLRLSSSADRQSVRHDYDGFYAAPFPATGSVTRIHQSQAVPEVEHERTPSQITLFPSAYNLEPTQGASPLDGANRRQPLRCSTTFQRSRRTSRAAVPGQTKLRQMVLAPDTRATMSSQDTHFSRFIGGVERPSTSDTNSPLRPMRNLSVDTFSATRKVIAHEHSPHLLCPERDPNPEDEACRRKLSWFIFASFCVLPPCIILHRVWGDSVISSLTEGRLGHCTPQSKRVALIAGIVVNIGIVTAILVPILVVHALKGI